MCYGAEAISRPLPRVATAAPGVGFAEGRLQAWHRVFVAARPIGWPTASTSTTWTSTLPPSTRDTIAKRPTATCPSWEDRLEGGRHRRRTACVAPKMGEPHQVRMINNSLRSARSRHTRGRGQTGLTKRFIHRCRAFCAYPLESAYRRVSACRWGGVAGPLIWAAGGHHERFGRTNGSQRQTVASPPAV